MKSDNLKKISVATLDAGGTNLEFGAVKNSEICVDGIYRNSESSDLKSALNSITDGFEEVFEKLGGIPDVISFAFPGPADYFNGVIYGELPNFPAFRSGVALSGYISDKFSIPVFINNDANLFVLGEALYGVLPSINSRLAKKSKRTYSSLAGFTLGTGLGFGYVREGSLLCGENSCTEIFCLPSRLDSDVMLEETVSARFIVSEYGRLTGYENSVETPKHVFEIAMGIRAGDCDAAKNVFETFGANVGYAASLVMSLFDAPVVLGGGLTAAAELYMPSLLRTLRSRVGRLGKSNETFARVQPFVYDSDSDFEFLASDKILKADTFGSESFYDAAPRLFISSSKLGASRAVWLGAYAFALAKLSRA